VTAERRLAKLEGSLSPKQAVLAWLAEAQEYGALPDYVRTILDVPVSEAPLTKIGERVEASARGSSKGRSRDELKSATHRAVGDAVFLYILALRLNLTAVQFARAESVMAAALIFRMDALMGHSLSLDAELYKAEPGQARNVEADWQIWCDLFGALSDAVQVEEAARASLEGQYLDGQPALFADAVREWSSLRDQVDGITRLADMLPAVVGPSAMAHRDEPMGEGSICDSVQARAREIADDARVAAFELLGQRERAVVILERRLRTSR